MTMEFISDVDERFMQDNLLSSEDWGDPHYFGADQLDVDDLVNDNGLHSAEEGQIENSLSPSHELLATETPSSELTCDDLNLAKAWLGIADEEQLHGLTGMPIKNEPLSPPPSSDSSDSSSESGQGSQILQNSNLNQIHIKLESPPLTPPRDSPGNSPSPGGTQQPAFFTLANGNLPNGVSKSLASGVINGSKKGVAIAPKPINNRGAIKLPLAPKVEHCSAAATATTAKVSIPSRTKPTVTVKHIPASAGQPIIIKQCSPSPFHTAQGSCAPPPSKQAKVLPPSSHPNLPSPTQSIAVVTQPCPSNVDVKVWKRQQRMIKNRESACLSRKKKKEYVQELECKAQNMEQEIQRLRSENLSLRSKMEALVNENSTLKKMHSSVFASPAKTATCLLVVVCIIGFNLGPLSLFSQSGSSGSVYSTSHHAGRALLEFTENSSNQNTTWADSRDSSSASATTMIHDIIEDIRFIETLGNQSTSTTAMDLAIATMKELRYLLPQVNQSCLHEMNVTDTIRLQDVLQFWAKRQLEDKKTKRKEEQAKKKSKIRRQRYQPPHRRYSSASSSRPALHIESEERALQIYDHLFQRSYDSLLEALHRRDDTFYVVSFKNDHLLLPATAHNITHRPKMSLVMPTVSGNESVWNTPKHHISMMQIDCEVVDTRVVHVKDQTSQPPVVQNETAYVHHHHHNAPADSTSPRAKESGATGTAFVGAEAADHNFGYHPRNLTDNASP